MAYVALPRICGGGKLPPRPVAGKQPMLGGLAGPNTNGGGLVPGLLEREVLDEQHQLADPLPSLLL